MILPASTSRKSNRFSIKETILPVVIGIALVASFMPLNPSQLYADEPAKSVSIIFTNDVHCKIDFDADARDALGYAGVAAYKKAAEDQYGTENVTLVDAGDAIQGDVAGTVTKGEALIDLMNYVGYDYAVPGNHEFDFGMDQFWNLRDSFEGTYLSCNFTNSEGTTLLEPYAIQSYDNVPDNNPSDSDDILEVAYVGITTPETLTSSNPTIFQDDTGVYLYDFCNDDTGDALYAAVQEAVDSAKDDGADYVVAVGHLGNTGITDRWTSESVIAHTTDIDAFIDGHSHETYTKTVENKAGEPVALAQTGTKLANVGELVITPSADDNINVTVTSYQDFTEVDEQTDEKVASINQELYEIAGQQVGVSEANLLSQDEKTGLYVRYHETNLADFITDAYRTTLDTDIAFINGGGIRASLDKGDVTLMDLISTQPFSNNVSKVKVKGQTILDALEMGVREYPEPSGGFLQVSGLTYQFDASLESPVIIDEHESFVRIDGPRRVSNVKVKGEPLDPNRDYTVASINYLLFDGGSGMSMFNESTVTVLAKDATIDNQAIVDYLNGLPNKTISKETYGNPEGQGRITVINDNNPYYPKDDESNPPIDDEEESDSEINKPTSDAESESGNQNSDVKAEVTTRSTRTLPDTSDGTHSTATFLIGASLLGLTGMLCSVLRINRIKKRP